MLIERLLKVALLGSSWVLYVLIFLSILSLTTAFERWLFFRKHKDDLDELRKKLVERLEARDVQGSLELVKSGRSIEARLTLTALNWAHVGPEAISDAVEGELALARKELERGGNFLGTVGNNAPFVGLLGTVLGVIISFQALGSNGQNSSAMGEVMAGIAEALVATGVGLFVALPAVAAYNVLQKRISDLESDVTAFTRLVSAYARSDAAMFALHKARVETPSNHNEKAATEATVQVAAVA
jgi:biopolymer transport protein ExbB/TolQ